MSRVKWLHGGYAIVPKAVISDAPECIPVFAVLSSYADADGVAWPGQDKIAERLGVSVSTVQRRLRRLVEIGWLTIDKGGDGQPNTYTLHEPQRSDLTGLKSSRPVTGARADRSPVTPYQDTVDQDHINGEQDNVQRDRSYEPITKESQVHKTAQDERREARQKGKRADKPVTPGKGGSGATIPKRPTVEDAREKLRRIIGE